VSVPADDAPPRVRVLRIISRMNVGGPALHALLLNERLDPLRYDSRLVAGQVGEAEGDYLVLHGADPERSAERSRAAGTGRRSGHSSG
jgi:hypothetical protein